MDDVTERAVSRPRMQQLAWNNTSTSLRGYEHLEHVLLSPDGTTVETAIDSKHRSASGQAQASTTHATRMCVVCNQPCSGRGCWQM
jgi:hypothetical protein